MKRIFLQKKQNKTILELLREQGEYLDAPCSGKGTCGKCCIIIEETRKTDPPKQREKEVFTELNTDIGRIAEESGFGLWTENGNICLSRNGWR